MLLGSLPFIEQYFGVWAIEPERFSAIVSQLRGLNLSVHMQSDRPEEVKAAQSGESFDRRGNIAVIEIRGVMMKQESSVEESTSTVEVRRKIRAAAANPDIAGILLVLDSPGGTVAGTADLANDVREAAKAKPVYAHTEDICASACMWVASQASKVYAGATSLVGSIGTYSAIADYSKAAELAGIKVHVLRAGDFKGAGEPGTEVTAEQLANWQRIVDDLNEHFLKGVAKGRAMSLDAVRKIADGRVHIAAEAQKLGLIDGVQSIDDTARQLQTAIRKGPSAMSQGNTVVALEQSTTQTAPVAASQAAPVVAASAPATIHELSAGCPGADDAFLCGQMKANATLCQAQSAWMVEQNKRLAAAKEEAAKAQSAAAPKPGVKALTGNTGDGGQSTADPIAAWNEAVAAKVKGGMSRPRAVSAVNRENPGMRQQMVDAFNSQRRSA